MLEYGAASHRPWTTTQAVSKAVQSERLAKHFVRLNTSREFGQNIDLRW